MTPAERARELGKMWALVREFRAISVPPPYSLEAAEALSATDLVEAVLAAGHRLVRISSALDEL